ALGLREIARAVDLLRLRARAGRRIVLLRAAATGGNERGDQQDERELQESGHGGSLARRSAVDVWPVRRFASLRVGRSTWKRTSSETCGARSVARPRKGSPR